MPRIAEDLIGQRFHRLIVVGRIWRINKYIWKCQCDCGNITHVSTGNLKSKDRPTKSCGCYNKELGVDKVKSGILNNTKPDGFAALYRLYDTYKRNALNRGYSWEIDLEYFKEITSKPCFYCGTPPKQVAMKRRGNGVYLYNGIDRLENSEGYNKLNIVPCCGICNRAKSHMPYNLFMQWINRLVTYRKDL